MYVKNEHILSCERAADYYNWPCIIFSPGSDSKTTTIRLRSFSRSFTKTSVFRHHGGLMESHPEFLRTSHHYGIEGFEWALQLGPYYAWR